MVSQKVPIIVGIFGMAFLCLAAFMTFYGFPKIINMKLKEGVSMENGTESFEFWKKSPFPIAFNVYIFNIMNSEGIQNGEKPELKETGPYVYDMYISKENIEIDEETDTVKFTLKKTFYFNSEKSACRSQDDIVTIINAALVGTVLMVQSLAPSAISMVSKAVPYIFPGAKNIFMKVKVKDFLFDGILLDCSASEANVLCQSIGDTAPETIRPHENERDFLFSLFHHLNASGTGPYVTGMGMKNTTRGKLFKYQDEPDLGEMWNSPYCNMLNGSDPTVFPPFGLNGDPKKRLYTFISDICRSVYVELENFTRTFDIPVYHYAINERLLRTPQEFKCFCPVVNGKPKCTPAGTMDLQPCMNSPTIFSWPHFYHGDESLLEYASGLNPHKEKHETYVQLEPMTGTPVKASKMAQFNMPIKRIDNFEMLSNVTPGILPMVWIQEYVELPPFLQVKLLDAYKGLKYVEYAKYGIVSIGFFLLIVCGILMAFRDRMLCFSGFKVHTTEISIDTPNIDHRPPLSASFNDFNNPNSGFIPYHKNGWKGEQFLN